MAVWKRTTHLMLTQRSLFAILDNASFLLQCLNGNFQFCKFKLFLVMRPCISLCLCVGGRL